MTTVIEVANLSLAEMGNRIPINSFDDGTAASDAAALFYSPKTKMLLRGAPWEFARKQVTLTLFKAAIVNGQVSSDPPPQPFQYSYLYPPDCLRARFIIPTANAGQSGVPLTTGNSGLVLSASTTTRVPFVVGADTSDGLPIKTIMTNLPNAQLIYTQDLSQYPDMWDAMFLAAETATLASYFINSLARDQAQMNAQIAIAKGALDSARSVNANEAITNADHVPDFLLARFQGWNGYGGGWANGANGTYYTGDWDAVQFPMGLTY